MSNFDDLNAIIVEGRLTKDPIIKDFGNNSCVSTLTIAVNSSYKGKDSSFVQEVGFFDIEVWNNAAKACNQYLTKGCKIRVKGTLKQNRWESNEGLKKSKVFIKADNVEFKSEKKKSTSDNDEIEGDEIEATLNINSIPTF
ncbi:MAG: single-stranded DNA-binding protein [Spirochaetia bacterium]|nr:single-stranded DNA-binding protein [Spirochaetia bacterium]